MRNILINWIIEVQDKFNYAEQTFFLTILLIAIYSSFKIILRSEYQLMELNVYSLPLNMKKLNYQI